MVVWRARPVMFELVSDVMDRFLNTNISSVRTLRNLVTPILQSPNRSAHTGKNQTVPYGTVHSGGDVPGTSCQATIALSLWGLSDFQLGR